MPRIGVITNPHAGKGRLGSRKAALEDVLGPAGLVLETASLDQLPAAVKTLTEAGCEYWLCDGGDGTLHWLLSTWLAEGGSGRAAPIFVPSNGGSIDFVAKKVRIEGRSQEVATRLRERLRTGDRPALVKLDTLRMTGQAEDNAFDRLGFATAIAGVAQRFFSLLYEHPRVGPLQIAQVIAMGSSSLLLNQMGGPLRQRAPEVWRDYAERLFGRDHVRVTIDGRELPFQDVSSLQVGSIDIDLGGVVRTFRKAAEPGRLHAQVAALSAGAIVANLPNVVMGTPLRGANVFDDAAKCIEVEAQNGTRLDPVIDGEQFHGLRSLTVESGPTISFARV